MRNFEKVMKQKTWTGAELGRIHVGNTLAIYNNSATSGRITTQGLVDKEKFREMLGTIEDKPEEIAIFNGYASIVDWLNGTMNMATTQEQAGQINITVFFNAISIAYTAEDIYEYIAKTPVVMTEKEYKTFTKKRTQELLKPNGEDAKHTLLRLVVDALLYYKDLLETKPRAKNPLKPLKGKLQNELVTNEKLLDLYNTLNLRGYYITADGVRSDEVSNEEWKRIEETNLKKENSLVREATLKEASLMYDEGMDSWEAYNERVKEWVNSGIQKDFNFNFYEDIPENLTKWKFLEEDNLEAYCDLFINCKSGSLAMAFCNEFDEVLQVIKEDIATKYEELEYIKDIPYDMWLYTNHSYEDLYSIDFYNFKNKYIDNCMYKNNSRALNYGIATLKNSPVISTDFKNTKYKKPDVVTALRDISLEGYFEENEHSEDNIFKLNYSRKLLNTALYFINGYNKTLDMIDEIYDIEELEYVKIYPDYTNEKINAFNNSVKLLYKRIKEIDYEDNELKEKKLKVLKEVLYPIDLSKAEIPEENIEATRENILNFSAFRSYLKNPVITLCREPEEGD